MQDAILEPNNDGQSMATSMFTLQQLINSLNQAQNDFQRDTGFVACHAGFSGDANSGINVSAGQEQVPLPQDCVDVRRLAWVGIGPPDPPTIVGTHAFLTYASQSITLPWPVLKGDLLVVMVSLPNSSSPVGVTDTIGSSFNILLNETAEVYQSWYAENCPAGTDTLNFSGIGSGYGTAFCQIVKMTDMQTTGVLDGASLVVGAESSSASITTTNATDVVLAQALGEKTSGVSVTIGPESTLIDSWSFAGGIGTVTFLTEYQETTSGGTQTSTVKVVGGSAAGFMVAIMAFKIAITPPPSVVSVTELPRQDSFSLDSLAPTWEASLGTPYTADESLPPVPSVNLSNQPADVGYLDVIYTPVPTQLSNAGVPLSVPPDCAVPIFWRALQILFSLQGEGADDQRARFAGEMYSLQVQLCKGLQFMTNMVPVR